MVVGPLFLLVIAPFKILIEVNGKWQIVYAHWAKSELLAVVKDFSNIKTNSLEFEQNFCLIISAYQTDFSDLY